MEAGKWALPQRGLLCMRAAGTSGLPLVIMPPPLHEHVQNAAAAPRACSERRRRSTSMFRTAAAAAPMRTGAPCPRTPQWPAAAEQPARTSHGLRQLQPAGAPCWRCSAAVQRHTAAWDGLARPAGGGTGTAQRLQCPSGSRLRCRCLQAGVRGLWEQHALWVGKRGQGERALHGSSKLQEQRAAKQRVWGGKEAGCSPARLASPAPSQTAHLHRWPPAAAPRPPPPGTAAPAAAAPRSARCLVAPPHRCSLLGAGHGKLCGRHE